MHIKLLTCKWYSLLMLSVLDVAWISQPQMLFASVFRSRETFLWAFVSKQGIPSQECLITVLSFQTNLHFHKLYSLMVELCSQATFLLSQWWTGYFFLIILISLSVTDVFSPTALTDFINLSILFFLSDLVIYRCQIFLPVADTNERTEQVPCHAWRPPCLDVFYQTH